MILAACLLGTLSVLVRNVSAQLHPFEIAFIRNAAQLMFMVPWVCIVGLSTLKTKRIGAHIRRSVFGVVAMLTWFWVLTQMPIAQATALSFSAPLFTTLGAALFLGERVGLRRWLAVSFGFGGVLMIIRPGFQDIGQAQVLAVVAAVLIAGAMLSNKSLTRSENPNVMVVWMGIIMSILSLPPAIMVWQWPNVNGWMWLGLIGLVATAAHLSINRAFAIGEASFIAPYGFVQIPFVALVGFISYGEIPDLWTWIGGGVIIGSGIYTAHREAKAKRQAQISTSAIAPPG